jgi:diacylglycerol kinase family enzyme
VLPDASIREGKVSIYAIEARTKSEFIKFAFFLPGGHHVQLKEVHSQHCKGGKLTTVPPMPVTVDGQVDMMTPVEFTTIPCGLNVMCAPNFLN